MKTAIVWFKTVYDYMIMKHLWKLLLKVKKLYLCIVLMMPILNRHNMVLKKNYRAQFLLESLQDLDNNCKMGSGLVI
jgi:hypothetical protein